MALEQASEDNSTNVIGPFQPGGLLNSRYRIEKPLGEGGFGRIYKACDLQVHGKTVVVKVLSYSASQDEWVRNKFLKESEALARIHHPGVVEVLDQGATPEGKLFIVMQFVDGVTLASALEKGPLEVARAGCLLSQAAEALTAAHEQGVCHRDLKPENIMLRKLPAGREQAVLIDFGIAGVKDSNVAGSVPTKVAGSLPYMAPEQLLGNPQTASDIYSLGVIAYKMVTGRTPFPAHLAVELYFQQQQGVQQKPSLLRPELPAAAEKAILKALAFDAKDRYARAMDFSEEFSQALPEPRTQAETQPFTKPAPPEGSPHGSLEMAYVLFMDVAGYSQLPTDQQISIITKLQEVVRGTATYREAQAGQNLISLPSGDGMALVFFKSPLLPVECAIEVGRALRQHPEIRLRMGVSQGPVYRVADINKSRNVAGGGINMAQRVMDCGDAGHILVSGLVADTLRQLSDWSASLRDLGECEVKHGVRVRLYNICKDGVGNPARPKKLPRPRWPWYAGIAALVAILAVGVGLRVVKQPPPPAVQRTLTYYFSVSKPGPANWIRYNRALQIIPAGYRLRFYFSSPEQGHLYLLNEGPAPRDGMASFNILFPTATTNNGSSALSANQELQFPGGEPMFLDKDEGDEKVYMVWSSQEAPPLEALKKWATLGHTGAVESAGDVDAIQAFLKSHQTAVARVDEENNRTVLNQTSDPLVYLVRLAHQ